LHEKFDCFYFQICSLSVGRDAIGCAFLGEKLLAVGGYNGSRSFKTVEEYDPESNEWSQLAPMSLSRAGACVIAIPNFIPSRPPIPSATV